MAKSDLNRILIKGGVLSPIELKQILDMCAELEIKNISFGSRQDILFPSKEGEKKVFEKYPNLNIEVALNKVHKNIVSSYLTADILEKTSWLNGSIYLYILHQLKLNNTLSINLVDPRQQFIPIFSGELNIVASKHESYWYIYLRLKHWKGLQRYPVLIHTQDLVEIVDAIQDFQEDCENIDELFNMVISCSDPSKNRNIDEAPIVSKDLFPYYEGMHRLEGETFWLGLYWRNNNYYVDFLQKVADLCLECKIGNICITPWKSIIIKKIKKADKLSWEKLLGKSGINVRHSLLELNWHIPVNDPASLKLKNYIVRIFDQRDISTYGLTLGIYNTESSNYFTSIVIQEAPSPILEKEIQLRPTYNVLHSENFDSTNLKYITYAQDVDKTELPGLLIELSKKFFEELGEETEDLVFEPSNGIANMQSTTIYQCSDCLSVYDEQLGDALQYIARGVSFDDLPNDYTCSVCEAPKSSFSPIDSTLLIQQEIT